MNHHRRRTGLLLVLPALAAVVLLFGGGLGYGLAQSLGLAGFTDAPPGLAAYRQVTEGPAFVDGLLLSLWISTVATVLAVVIGVAAALALRRTAGGRRTATFLAQLGLPVPHLIGAVAIGLLLADSGLLARTAHAMGVPLPALVADPYAIGVIVEYVWKEAPFVLIVVLAALGGPVGEHEQVAATLGASPRQVLRRVTLPLLAPSILAVAVLIFAFTLGAYEVPALLGRAYPQPLPVLAYQRFTAAELSGRAEGVAVALLIAAVAVAAAGAYTWASRRAVGDVTGAKR
ncbi:carbohydrate ABC transporter membrane protein 1 (CUT1 family) [Micromonospora sp. Llam0]|uniref:ABC transporter permease n=1 Tax=Micromonospora sp. Llam0 TaxID=2485143 RepID=UPI000F492BA8|nr:ABC transporter permease subunit [Micromonospora sp. Llam0]ROO51988.1 carbohydrate ABC transporter membrane protein 1 (CUT1 family) [Micromonospora sp. Llam0]